MKGYSAQKCKMAFNLKQIKENIVIYFFHVTYSTDMDTETVVKRVMLQIGCQYNYQQIEVLTQAVCPGH